MKISRLELVHNVQIAGSLASTLIATGEGAHNGWTLNGNATGVMLEKGDVREFIPWTAVKKATPIPEPKKA